MATYYVATTGNDSNPGTEAEPFLTLQRANNALSAGDTVIVEDGTYTGTGTLVLTITKSGTAGNWITFKARNAHQAIVDGENRDRYACIGFSGTSQYVRIEGFRLKEGRHRGFSLGGNSNNDAPKNIEIVNNIIHDIGRYVTNDNRVAHSGAFTSPFA